MSNMWQVVFGCVSWGVAGICMAASLQASPTALTIPASGRATSLTLLNEGDSPIHAQARVMRWFQAENSDHLADTEEAFASPPILAIPAHGKQIVRVVVPGKVSNPDFRVLVDELPPESGPGLENSVAMLIRYSIPLVVERPGLLGAPDLHWEVKEANGLLSLHVRNSGLGRAQLSDFRGETDGLTVLERSGLVGYVLGGADREWSFKLKGRTPAVLKVRINGNLQTIHSTGGQ